MLLNLFIGFYKSGLFPFYEHLPATSIETYFKNLLTKNIFFCPNGKQKGKFNCS